MIKLCDVNSTAREKLPSVFRDKSGIGVHYVDAFIAPMNAALPDNTRVSCKRKGLKITLRVGTKKGEGLMRRLEVSPDISAAVPLFTVRMNWLAQGQGRHTLSAIAYRPDGTASDMETILVNVLPPDSDLTALTPQPAETESP